MHICTLHTLGSLMTQSSHNGVDRLYPAHTTLSNTHDDNVDTNIPIPLLECPHSA